MSKPRLVKTVEPVDPAVGLYKNGALWWIRTVRAPLLGIGKPLSTGTPDVRRANKIKAMVDTMGENPTMYEWLSLAVQKDGVKLDTLYTHNAAGTLNELRERRATAKAVSADADLDPWVDRWVRDDLAPRVANGLLRQESADACERHVRRLIPKGTPFPKSQFNEDYLKVQIASYTGARHGRDKPLSSATRLRHYMAWQLFYKWARKRVPLTGDSPFEDANWVPENSIAREVNRSHAEVLSILEHLDGEVRVAIAVMFGSGIELGALLAMKGADVKGSTNDGTGRGFIVAHGTKNRARRSRRIYVDAWAWAILEPHANTVLPRGSMWSFDPKKDGKELREPFYRAQLAAGQIEKPQRSKGARKFLWSAVEGLHTLHDCRHSYVVTRLLGDDGEEPQSIGFCAMQLGHIDETMIIKIYNKARIATRLEGIQREQERKARKRGAA